DGVCPANLQSVFEIKCSSCHRPAPIEEDELIMTTVYASTPDIQADFPPRESDKTPPEVWVIDFNDHQQQDTRQGTVNRIKEPRRQGMEVQVPLLDPLFDDRSFGKTSRKLRRNSATMVW